LQSKLRARLTYANAMATVAVLMALGAAPAAATTPTFSGPTPFDAGSSPFTIVAADFDLDGKPDLATANDGSTGDAGITALRNTTTAGATTPSFGAATPFDTGSLPRVTVALDVNADGKPDLATANEGTSGVGGLTVNLDTSAGPGTLTFSDPTGFNGGTGPTSVAAADINGDGKPDLVGVTPSGTEPVHVLLNTTPAGAATPSFRAADTYGAGSTPLSVATPDVNRDGRPDIVVANVNGSAADRVTVLLNATPTGATASTFLGPFPVETPAAPVFVTSTDANGDGKPDLVVAHNSGAPSLLLNSTPAAASRPTFSGPIILSAGEAPESATSTDVNRDGKPDLVFADRGVSTSGANQLLVNTTEPGAELPTYSGPTAFPAGNGPVSIAAADLNGDGRLDLASANTDAIGAAGGNTVLLNTTPAALSSAPASLAFGGQPLATISAPRTVTLANTTDATLPVRVGISGAADDFLISRNTCGDGVPADGSCDVAVRFAPSAAGARAATLTLDPAGPQTTTVGLTGTGGALPHGATGATGPAGPAGPRGRDAKVTCKVAKRKKGSKRIKVTCRVQLVKRASAASWRLTRRGRTVARGRLRARASRLTLRRLAPGRYTLRISGRRALTLRVARPGLS
jgi:FG-GAP-like repeat